MAVGLDYTDLYADQGNTYAPPALRQPDTSYGAADVMYRYLNHAGEAVAEKGRFESGGGRKSFKWRGIGDTAWLGLESHGLKLTDLALYGSQFLTEANKGQTVYFTEGEKARQACEDAGLLAVCFAGGASTKDFGIALEVLRGRTVALWPDNDAPGKEYMAVAEARLRGLASELKQIDVPVPAKGDAYEYFGAGGSVADLESGAVPLKGPVLKWNGDDAVTVKVPTLLGPVRFVFTDMERSTRGSPRKYCEGCLPPRARRLRDERKTGGGS